MYTPSTTTHAGEGRMPKWNEGESGCTGRSKPNESPPEKQSFPEEARRSVNENMHVGDSVHQHVEIAAGAHRSLDFASWRSNV